MPFYAQPNLSEYYPVPVTAGTDIGATLNALGAKIAAQSGVQSSGATGSLQARGGKMLLPQGLFYTSQQIVLPTCVSLHGRGKRSTILMASSSFPINTGTVTFTNSSAIITLANANTKLFAGQRIYFTTPGSMPTNFTAGVYYYVQAANLTSSGFQVSVGIGTGGTITAASAGTGPWTYFAQTALIDLGGANIVQDCYVKDMWLHCGATTITNTQGIISRYGQEGCGARHVIVDYFTDIGIYCSGIGGSGGWGNMYFEELEIGGAAPTINYGMKLDFSSCVINKATFTGAGAGVSTNGLFLDSAGVHAEGLHFEGFTNGLYADGNCYGAINGIDDGGSPNGCTNIVNFAGIPLLTVRGITNNGSTNVFQNDQGIAVSASTNPFVPDLGDMVLYGGGTLNEATISVANNTQYQWQGQRKAMITINGGTLTSLALNRYSGPQTLPITTSVFLMAPGDNFTATFTGSPTFVAWPM